jgi:trehalose 6-phosphate synthase/phosphatase
MAPFDASLGDLREQVRELEDQHRANGVPLSGRIIHVCHYLPITSTLMSRSGVLSPPTTPPTETPPQSTSQSAWTLSQRYGHSAMVSGIRSLAATHEQFVIGWTGDVLSPTPGEIISESSISQEDRESLEGALKEYQSKEEDEAKIHYVPVWLNDKVAHGHYEGYCKTSEFLEFFRILIWTRLLMSHQPVLWPLFHYLLWQDVATEYSSADHNYPFYEAANAAFARRIADVYRPGDLVWVHDYHLLLVPKLVREVVPDAVLGLFVHTPFPSSEVFRCLPRRKEILDGMLGADLVCFQTYSYTRHFISTCVRVCGYESNHRGIDVEGHITSIGHCAVGIDAERVARDM